MLIVWRARGRERIKTLKKELKINLGQLIKIDGVQTQMHVLSVDKWDTTSFEAGQRVKDLGNIDTFISH